MADFKTIKEHVSIFDVLGRYGVQLKGVNGTTRIGNCPLPQHTSPNKWGFKVWQGNKGWGWSCHSDSCVAARNTPNNRKGGLKEGGDLIELVKHMEQLPSLAAAGEVLESWFGPFGGDPRPKAPEVAPVEVDETPAANVPLKVKFNDPDYSGLKGVVHSHEYLLARGFEEEECEYLGVGYFPGKGMMSGRIVFPVHDSEGELVAYLGRSTDPECARSDRWRFPGGFQKGLALYNLHRVETDSVVVVESPWSVLAGIRAGLMNFVALFGADATDSQVAQLVDRFRRITILLDGDEAGRKGTKNLCERLVNAGAESLEIVMLRDSVQPDHLSPDELRQFLRIPPEPYGPLTLVEDAPSSPEAVPA